VEIQATLSGHEVCVGSTFTISAPQVRIADVIIFGNLVSGFVIRAREDELIVDISTAVLECKPASGSNARNVWEISALLVPESAH